MNKLVYLLLLSIVLSGCYTARTRTVYDNKGMTIVSMTMTNMTRCKYNYQIKANFTWELCTDRRFDVGDKLTITTQDVLKEHIDKVKGY